MEYRRLGRMGRKSSRAWAPCSSAGRPTEATSFAVLDAFEAGGKFISRSPTSTRVLAEGNPGGVLSRSSGDG